MSVVTNLLAAFAYAALCTVHVLLSFRSITH